MFSKYLAAAAAAAIIAGGANAAVVTGLYNTGVGAGGAPLAAGDGQIDGNYVVLAGATVPGVGTGAAETYKNALYAAETPLSRWVSYSGAPFAGNGSFTVQTTFDLTGYKASTAKITGTWGVDNEGDILLNGAGTGNTLTGTVFSSFVTLHSFTISGGFVSGMNTLGVAVTDTGPPAAVRLDSLVLTADAVPEPATWSLLVAGFGLVGAATRRRATSAAA